MRRRKGEGEEGEEEEYPVWLIVNISSILVPYRHVKFNIVNRHAPPEIPQQCC